jgi:alpha-glucosidase
LNAFRQFLAWRRTMPTLLVGDIRFLACAEPVLMFERVHGEETLLLAFNLSAEIAQVALPVGQWQVVQVPGPDAGEVVGSELVLPAQSMYCARRG